MLSERRIGPCRIDERYDNPDAEYFDGLCLNLVGDPISIADALEEESSNGRIFEVDLTIEPGTFASLDALAKFQNLEHLRIVRSNALHLRDLSTLGLCLKTLRITRGVSLQNLVAFQNFTGQVDSLSLSNFRDLKSLEGVGNFQSLRKLTIIGFKQITDISEISQLQNLEDLCLSNIPGISDIAPLQRLPKLAELMLDCLPNLFDISPIQNLMSLENFALYRCSEVIDISPLGNVENLTVLSIYECPKIVDASALSKLKKLKDFWLVGSQQQSYFQIARLQSDLPKFAIPLPWSSSSGLALRHHLAVAYWRIFIYLSRWLRPSQ